MAGNSCVGRCEFCARYQFIDFKWIFIVNGPAGRQKMPPLPRQSYQAPCATGRLENSMSINKIDGPGGVKPGAPKRAGSTGATGGTSFASMPKEPEKSAGARKSAGDGSSVSVRADVGGGRSIKK